ncbi:MAG: YhbY family RNA-binding protein [Candidatus Cloacimonetes bacterium]|nr:YhbY family RNA-binding protein [Candidatus Cloacimonadota bacterium]
MKLKGKQKALLKKAAHNLAVTVMIGDKGITENLIKSLDKNLTANELIKASISHPDRKVRAEMSNELAEKTNSIIVNSIGKTFLFYRENSENPKISLKVKKIK